MKNFRVLKFLDRCKGLFEKLGVDYEKMRSILQVKLVMDSRKVPTILAGSGNQKNKKSENENQFIKSLWIYVILGGFMAVVVAKGNNYMLQMSLFFGVLIFMILTSLVSDFSSVLLDTRDKTIIYSKPVDRRTMGMAKFLHIFIYMFYLTMAITGPALAVSLIRHGIGFFILFLAEIILIDVFVVVLTALLYLVILRFFDGERLKDIINYFQIGLTVAMTLGYQLLIRVFDFMDASAVLEPEWWHYFIIPIWYGAPFEWILKGVTNGYYTLFSVFAVIVPLISIFLYIKLIPLYERSLQRLTSVSGSRKKKKRFTTWSAKVLCKSREEQIFFRFAADMMANERDFKLKLYPGLGISLILPFFLIFNALDGSSLDEIKNSRMYYNMYFSGMVIPTLVMMLNYSKNFKAAWIYKMIPIRAEGSIYKGVLKAGIARYLFPLFLFVGMLFISLFGFRILPDLTVMFLGFLLFVVLCFKSLSSDMPFSEAFEAIQQNEGIKTFLLLTFLLLLAALHFSAAYLFEYGVYIYLILLFIINLIAWKWSFPTKNKIDL
ncbi:hypothetical protein [Bacillus sp. V59.32b]|uniref:hypothetical protein n=1 Tax=Bacillus sp. V59.32b TaxID=1758642 RepID=UPI000E3BDE6E|nr:hypothetical protein [Bacillus sp. V59.32b]RFU64038.1 hypothetical protein D0463_11190 [Bacillus sp. V59.32b]